MEVELKLCLSPSDARKIARHPIVVAATRSPPKTLTLHSVYFDTPDHALAAAGIGLRLRRIRNRWIQTLKWGGGVRAGLHAREEFEAPAPGGHLDLGALIQTPLAAHLSDPGFAARLAPVFTTRFRRSARVVELAPGAMAEFAIDLGDILAGERLAPICEIEVELLDGSPKQLFAFARALAAEFDLDLENRSKAERGFALASGRTAAPARAEAPDLQPSATVPEAFGAIIANCAAQLQANKHGVVHDDDPEYVHQARVAIRRLRSAFSLFGRVVPKPFVQPVTDAFRALGVALGSARDWDVFATETLPPAQQAFGGDPGIAAIEAAAAMQRADARAQARAAMASRQLTILLLDTGSLLAEAPWRDQLDAPARELEALPLAAFADRVVRKQAKRVRRAGAGVARSDAAGLHALRIEVKKLRYALEFFSALSSRKALRQRREGAAELQEILGHLNDAAVTAHLVEALHPEDAVAAFGAGLIRGWTAGRGDAGLDRFDAAWKRFQRTDFGG